MTYAQGIIEDKLSKGIHVVTENLPGRKSISIGVWADVGSRDEPLELQGCSHLIEHMLFKGTKRRSAEEISKVIENRGGNLNAFTDREFTCYTARVLDRDTALAIDVIADMLQNSLFRREDLQREKAVVLEEISRRDDNPESLIRDLSTEAVWKGNLVGHPVLGTKETIKNVTREQVESYFHGNYGYDRIVVSAAGKLEHGEFMDMLEKNFLEGMYGKNNRREEPVYQSVKSFHERESSQVQLCVSADGFPYAKTTWYELNLLSSYLGEGASSKLFQEVREKRGLVYSIYSQNLALKDCGLFEIFAGTSRSNATEVLELILKELYNIREGRMEEDALEKTKQKFEGELTLQMDSSRTRMFSMGISKLRLGRVLTPDEMVEMTNNVSIDDISNIASKIFETEDVSLITLGLPRELEKKIGGLLD